MAAAAMLGAVVLLAAAGLGWTARATQAHVSPTRRDGADLELRRRRSLERVHAALIAEDYSG